MGFNKQPETGIGVKKANVVEQLSKDVFEERVKNIAHAMKDIVWWAENFFRIITLDKGLTTIKLYDRQKDLLKFITGNTRICTLASRQTGKTTTYTVFCLWYATLFYDKRILICANKLATAIEVMNRIRKAYEELPFWIKPGIVGYSKSEITFANGSSIRAFSTSSSGARGASGNVLIIDEMAFIPKNIIDEFFASVMPIVSSSKKSKVIIVSTPNGASGMYYDIWQQANSKEALANKEGWKPFRIHWYEVPGRDEEWKKQRIAADGMQVWQQEYECDFLASSTIHKLIPDETTDKLRQKYQELKLKGLVDGKKQHIFAESGDKIYEFTMWHEFDKTRTYIASGDIAEGVGGDSSILYVWDITDLSNITQCAKFESNTISVVEFAYVISKILALYNNPYFVAERNGVSSGTIDSLRITYKYPRLVTEGKNNEPGVYSHVTIKGKACLWAREMLTTNGFGFTFYDHDILDEFSTFVKKDTKGVHVVYSALPPAHDDFVMTLVWLCYILQNTIIEKYFVVIQTFKSDNGIVYPKLLHPMQEYTTKEIEAATNDPLYKEFLDFKDEVAKKLGHALQLERNEDNGIFQFQNTSQDMYFGGYDTTPSWNSTTIMPNKNVFDLNPNNRMPSFFVNTCNGFY